MSAGVEDVRASGTSEESTTPLRAVGRPEAVARRALGRTPRVGAAPSRATSTIVLVLAGVFFLVPIAAMVEFSLRQGRTGSYTLQHYAAVLDPAQEYAYDGLFQGTLNSLAICAITVLIVLLVLLPTMILVELRYPALRRALEFVCILPITIPTVVIGVGFLPVYSVIARLVGSDAWSLAFAIGIIVLPYAYRPIAVNLQGLDVAMLSEAARSLGAGWGTVMVRVLVPNLRRGILASCFITIAVVLGEFTIATFLSRTTFQTALVLIQHTDPYVAVIFALLALVFGFVLLLVIGRLGAVRRRA